MATWVLGGILFYLLDVLRGNADSTLQRIARELFVPGLAGYLAMLAVARALDRYIPALVFGGFVTIVGILLGAYLALWWVAAEVAADQAELTTWERYLPIFSFLCTLAGALYGYREEMTPGG
ncbi:MAG: hypothetical protein ACE5HV_13540 [Acidobacteriota bacterium]